MQCAAVFWYKPHSKHLLPQTPTDDCMPTLGTGIMVLCGSLSAELPSKSRNNRVYYACPTFSGNGAMQTSRNPYRPIPNQIYEYWGEYTCISGFLERNAFFFQGLTGINSANSSRHIYGYIMLDVPQYIQPHEEHNDNLMFAWPCITDTII